MEIKDFKPGQKVFVKLVNNAARGIDKDKLIEEWEVTKVGRKYLHARRKDRPFEEKFCKPELITCDEEFIHVSDYSPDYFLYAHRTTIEKIDKRKAVQKEIKKFVDSWRLPELSDSELETIYNIIKTKE